MKKLSIQLNDEEIFKNDFKDASLMFETINNVANQTDSTVDKIYCMYDNSVKAILRK